MILEIVNYGTPVLREKGAPVRKVDDKIRQLAIDMLETMEDAHGVGLAAQQVGVALQMCVINVAGIEDRPSTMEIDGKPVDPDAHMPLVLLNPELELGAERESGSEGCLSFPDITADVLHAARVIVRARNLEGAEVRFSATGLLARALQHEVDHLHGILFVDRMSSAKRFSLGTRLKRLQRETTGA